MKGREAQILGETAELLASLCFEQCPYRMPSWVKSIRRATHEEDHQGVDLVAEIDTGPVKIQVKSGWKRAREFQRDHPDIPVFVVGPEDSEEYVRRKLLNLLRQERAKLLPSFNPSKDRKIKVREIPRSRLVANIGEMLATHLKMGHGEYYNEYHPRLHGKEAEAARNDPNKPNGACCNNEKRGMNGGCANCGDPCL